MRGFARALSHREALAPYHQYSIGSKALSYTTGTIYGDSRRSFPTLILGSYYDRQRAWCMLACRVDRLRVSDCHVRDFDVCLLACHHATLRQQAPARAGRTGLGPIPLSMNVAEGCGYLSVQHAALLGQAERGVLVSLHPSRRPSSQKGVGIPLVNER